MSSRPGDRPYSVLGGSAVNDETTTRQCPGCNDPHSDSLCCRCGHAEHPEANKAGRYTYNGFGFDTIEAAEAARHADDDGWLDGRRKVIWDTQRGHSVRLWTEPNHVA